jgi:ABC-type phosphate/phosphonate transport system substrate-binding protein
MTTIANARMYSATPELRGHWKTLLAWVLRHARLDWELLDYEAPAPLAQLWARDDLGAVLMCGLPFSRHYPRAQPVAAPIPSPAHYGGRAVYFTDIVVPAGSAARELADTFGGRVGITVPDSLSGAVALAEHLQPYRKAMGRPLYSAVVGGLIHARGVIQSLSDGRIDVGPLDSYYHDLLRAADPQFASRVRVVARTVPRPLPLFVATAPLSAAVMTSLRDAFAASAETPQLATQRAALLLKGFAFPGAHDYESLRELPERLESPNDAF